MNNAFVRREWPVYLVLLALLAAIGGWVAVSRFPASAPVAAAERWPLVGGWIGDLRRLYLPPEPRPEARSERAEAFDGAATEVAPAGGARGRSRDGEAGATDATELAAPPVSPPPGRSFWLAPGEPLRARPRAGSEVVIEADAFTEVPVLERSGRWLRVRFAGREGWVLPPERAPGEPPLGRDPAPPRPLPPQAPDPALLAAARALLAGGGTAGRLGPYDLYSDAAPDLVDHLARVAAAVDLAYAERYRQAPVGAPAEAVVLFADEADYRAFQQGEERLAALPSGGHASRGVVAIWAGDRRREEVASTLIHELTHLANRRALGPALPPWLDEGLAEDLAGAAIGPGGEIDPGGLGGAVERAGSNVTYHGARAALRQIAELAGSNELPALSRLVALDWDGFVRPARRDVHYPLAGFFVRFLLTGEGGALRQPFRDFLAAVAAGEPPDGEALLGRLGRSWDSLQWSFELWLRGEAAAEAGWVAGGAETADRSRRARGRRPGGG